MILSDILSTVMFASENIFTSFTWNGTCRSLSAYTDYDLLCEAQEKHGSVHFFQMCMLYYLAGK